MLSQNQNFKVKSIKNLATCTKITPNKKNNFNCQREIVVDLFPLCLLWYYLLMCDQRCPSPPQMFLKSFFLHPHSECPFSSFHGNLSILIKQAKFLFSWIWKKNHQLNQNCVSTCKHVNKIQLHVYILLTVLSDFCIQLIMVIIMLVISSVLPNLIFCFHAL